MGFSCLELVGGGGGPKRDCTVVVLVGDPEVPLALRGTDLVAGDQLCVCASAGKT